MKIHELQLTTPSGRKRVGRGIGSGRGKTAGRGTKGQNARTGGGVRLGFEGGQNPLAKRLPKKRGFSSLAPVRYQVVKLDSLNRFKAGTVVDPDALAAVGLVKKASARIKLLAGGELKAKLTVQLHAASVAAKAAVEAAGGSVQIIPLARTRKAAPKSTDTEPTPQVAGS